MSDKIKKLASIWIIFNKIHEVWMTSFITKKELETPAILDPPLSIIQFASSVSDNVWSGHLWDI